MRRPHRSRSLAAGFTLLPVVLAMSLTGAIAFMLNRDNGLNANRIGAQSDLARARYAAEAGLQAVNYAIQALGCAGVYPISSSPITDSSFGGASYTAHANNTTGSPLTLTSSGTYNGASVTLTKSSAYVYRTGIWFVEFKPSAAGKDAAVDEEKPTESFGGKDRLEMERNKEQILIAFDFIPALPVGSRILRYYNAGALQPGAVISLYQTDADADGGFEVKLIKQNWVEGNRTGGGGQIPTPANPGVTWNRWDGLAGNEWAQGPGNGYDPRTLIVVPETPFGGWTNIDVTDAAAAWLSGVYPNYGVWLVPFPNTQDYNFTSSEDGTASQRPKITVYFLQPC